MAKSQTDKKILEMINDVARRKAEIKAIDRPRWKTNCSLAIKPGGATTMNLHAESSVQDLIAAAGLLIALDAAYSEAVKAMQIDDAPPYRFGNYAVADWLADIKARIDKLNVADKKQRLDELESRLNAIVSPQLRAELELKDIAGALQGE